MRGIVKTIRRTPARRADDRNGGFPRLSGSVPHGSRCPAPPRHALLAESLGKPSLWVFISAAWYKVWVDFGAGIGIKKTSAQATAHYGLEELIGRQVAAVVNFPAKQIGKFMSEILILGFPDGEGEVVLIGPERPVPNGGRLY